MKRFAKLLLVLVLPAAWAALPVSVTHLPQTSSVAHAINCGGTDYNDGSTSCVNFGGGSVGNCYSHPNDPSCIHSDGSVTGSPCGKDGVNLSVPIVKGQSCISGDPQHGGVIVAYLKAILIFLAGLVGGIIVLMLIIAGIEYLTSTGDPGRVKSAKNRIINAITALVLFAFMYAILNFLIPGGILS